MDNLLYKHAMVDIGLTELSNRASEKSLWISSILATISVLLTIFNLFCT
ncbi:MAG: hypothetical protein RLZZ76_2 [Candidatus Parcubacteria bacterium]|jgi:hypothetical protein